MRQTYYNDQDTCPLFPEVEQEVLFLKHLLADALYRLNAISSERSGQTTKIAPWEGIRECGERVTLEDCLWWKWTQTWGDTTCGWGGMGGQAITGASVFVMWARMYMDVALVYHSGRFAYMVDKPNDKFSKAMMSQSLPGPRDAHRHLSRIAE